MESIAVKVPGLKQLYSSALILRPRVAIDKRRIHGEYSNGKGDERYCDTPTSLRILLQPKHRDAVEEEVEDLAQAHDCEVERGEIVVQEQLSGHQVEREVVEGPSEDSLANLVVKSFEVDTGVVVAAALPSKDRNALEDDVGQDG